VTKKKKWVFNPKEATITMDGKVIKGASLTIVDKVSGELVWDPALEKEVIESDTKIGIGVSAGEVNTIYLTKKEREDFAKVFLKRSVPSMSMGGTLISGHVTKEGAKLMESLAESPSKLDILKGEYRQDFDFVEELKKL